MNWDLYAVDDGETSCSQSLLIELATDMLKTNSLEENCVGICRTLSTGFIAGESELHKLASVCESIIIGSSALAGAA